MPAGRGAPSGGSRLLRWNRFCLRWRRGPSRNRTPTSTTGVREYPKSRCPRWDHLRVDHVDPESVAFSDASRGRGYHRGEVDAFVDRVEATLRNPAAPGGVTPADLRDVAFSKPPIGQLGYHEGEVDAFLDRAKTELSGPVPGQGPAEPIRRCLLYRYASSDPQTPALAVDVAKDSIRVIDLNGCDPNNGALIACFPCGGDRKADRVRRDSRFGPGRTRFARLDHPAAPATG